MKRCSRCGDEKELEEFHKNKNNPDGRTPACAECNRVRVRSYAAAHAAKKYGLPLSTLSWLRRQPCMICGSRESNGSGAMHIDHDHASGAVRGVLCQLCNTGIGSLKDSPELLLKALNYLTRTGDYRAVDQD